MKAIVRDRYGSVEVLRLEEVPTPIPGEDEVLVRVHAASVNTADLDHLLGRPRVARLGTGLLRPRWRVPGLDMAGVVESVGAMVTRLRPGDEVWADMFSHGHGAFAEYVCAPEEAFTPKPGGIGFAQAATVPHSASLALQALRSKAPIEPGQRLLVNGGGGCVGPFAIQIAKTSGAEVTGVDHGTKFDLMKAAGADHLVDYTMEDVTRSERRFDFIVDIAADRSVFPFKRILDQRGSYVQIARSVGGFFQAALFGAMFGGTRRMGVFMWVPNSADDLAELGRLLEEGRVTPVIDRTYPLVDVPAAMRRLADGQARGKIVITI